MNFSTSDTQLLIILDIAVAHVNSLTRLSVIPVAQPQECLSRRRVTSSATAAVAQPHSVSQRLHTAAFPVKVAVLRAVVGGIRARVGARLFK